MSRITGILKDGMGKPIVNCKIMLKALRTSTTVIVHTVASQNPNEAGLYDMTVESGQYRVMLCADGYPPEYVGDIQVYKDSPSGTLNYFLGLPQDNDLRPDAIKHFEAMVAKVSAQSAEVEKNKAAAAESAREALNSQQSAHGSELAAAESATAALASQNAAKASEQSAASGAQSAQASQQAAKASESAAADSAAAALASQNAAKAAEQAAASSSRAAQASQQSAHSSESAAAGSATAALASQNAAKASEQAASSSAATAANDAATKAAAATEAKLKEAVRIDADRAAASATESNASALQAGNFASSARDSQTAAAQAATQASGSASVSVSNANAAKTSETAAAGSASSAAQSALQASGSASTAASSASAAKASETAAAGSAQNAKAEADRTVGLLSTKQDKSPLLSAIAGLMTSADKLPYFTEKDAVGQTVLTQVGRDIIGKATIAAVLEYLGLRDAIKQMTYGCPLIGTCISWCNERMPQEIWPDCGMEFIPYMGQQFDKTKFPLLAVLHPSGWLPVDMRGYAPRGWDNARGIDPGRALLSGQEDAMQQITGELSTPGGGANFLGEQITATGPFTVTGTSSGIADVGGNLCPSRLVFDSARVVRTASETRVKNVAWNMIVRAK
ncbi:prophage tail fiber N-terminal domain-containing protein [Edwardsiella tarda]